MRQVLLAVALLLGALVAPPPRAHAAPILPGGTTDVTLTGAPLLASLGATVAPVGLATITGGTPPVASFPITGGESRPNGTLRIEHAGSGLLFSGLGQTLEITNFVVDTLLGQVFVDVAINGVPLATGFAAFDLGGGTPVALTLTAGAAAELNARTGLTVFNTGIEIGAAVTDPRVVPVPAPGALAVALVGLAGLAWARRPRRAATPAPLPA